MLPDWEIAVRLVLAAALGSFIGFERERLLWAAGIRTHMVVGVGACLVMVVSAYGFQGVLNERLILDPSRVAAQVVSGIGFLGAGSILLRGSVVRGLTIAAGHWRKKVRRRLGARPARSLIEVPPPCVCAATCSQASAWRRRPSP